MSEQFNIELEEAKKPEIHAIANVNPFDDKDANWEERETEMIALMKERFGIGLASNQLGMLYRMFVMKMEISGIKFLIWHKRWCMLITQTQSNMIKI